MPRFNNNTVHRFGQTTEAIKNMMANAIPIWELNGMTEEEYNSKFERKPLWEISGFKNEEEWAEHFKPKTTNTVINNEEEIINKNGVLNIPENEEGVIQIPENVLLTILEEQEKEPEPVKEKVKVLENKIKSKSKSKKWA
jgi:hypothetical protein